ncbi:MAG: hypothetical protein WC477_06335 [Patescibacteria group bacterium]
MEMKWYGKEATDKAIRALRIGIDKTTSIGTIEAKNLVNKDTTALQGSIYPEPAKLNDQGQVEGVYGPHRAANPASGEDVTTYATYQEFYLGERMPDGSTRERKGGKPYMRPSMRKAESVLMDNIVKAYKGLS